MNRIILFKGQEVETKKWVFGGVSYNKSKTKYWINTFDNDGFVKTIEIIKETVCQFTGLIDVNGTLIYENDIIKYTEHKGYLLPNLTATVLWIDDSACFGYKRHDVPNWSNPAPFVEHDEIKNDFLNHIEVIGNVFEMQGVS